MPSEVASSLAVREFKKSLPPSYSARYESGQIAAHARIAGLREQSLVSLGAFDSGSKPQLGLCVVARDQAGLLATLSGTLAAQGFDISDAEAYTRTAPNGEAEAVDIFWVARTDPAEDNQDPTGISEAELVQLHGVLTERLSRRDAVPTEPPSSRSSQGTETRVRFLESEAGVFSTLEVETDDHSGLLQTLASALFRSGVQINSSQIRTDGKRVYDRFDILELDGSPISPERRLEIQIAVLGAIQSENC